MQTSLQHLNRCPAEEFTCLLGRIFEHAPWVAGAVAGQRPFESRQELLEAMCAAARNLKEEQQLALVRKHAELAGQGPMSAEARREQEAVGLGDLSEAEAEVFESYNREYKMRFGFPFVVCTRRMSKEAILGAYPERLKNSREVELGLALRQIYQIAGARLEALVREG